MMEQVASYIFSLVCGGILCAVLLSFGSDNLRKLLCGVFMLFLVITPLRDVDLDGFSLEYRQIALDAEAAAGDGKKQASEAVVNIITDTCASYILTEAAQLGAEVTVTVELDAETQLPCAAVIRGSVTPYARQMLAGYMADTLGIPKEAQQWISS